jgi:hypothetical protein
MINKGEKFGRWTVISEPLKHKRTDGKKVRIYYWCRCICGVERKVLQQNLLNGRSESCGCWNREKAAERMRNRDDIHHLSKSRVYRIWLHMRERCSSKDRRGYYFKRGIRCCDEWNDFKTFYLWAIKNGYNDKLTLDRIDNSKGYSSENCRWATWQEQQRNKTNNRIITYKGKSMILAEWADFYHTTRGAINYRDKHGLPLEGSSH